MEMLTSPSSASPSPAPFSQNGLTMGAMAASPILNKRTNKNSDQEPGCRSHVHRSCSHSEVVCSGASTTGRRRAQMASPQVAMPTIPKMTRQSNHAAAATAPPPHISIAAR